MSEIVQGTCCFCGVKLMSNSTVCIACFRAKHEVCLSCCTVDKQGNARLRKEPIHTDSDGGCTTCGGERYLLAGKRVKGERS